MPLLRRWIIQSVIVLLPAWAFAAPQNAATPGPSSLSPAEMKQAVTIDTITVPTPGEFFKAMDKGGKPNWASAFRPPISISGVSRAQMALNLGTLIADGYIAVEAEDGQQVKNIGRDVLTLAKKLNVSDSVIARGKSISQFAENGAWDQLNEELEATQNEVKKALDENRDTDLITLVSVGGWIRGTQVVTGLIGQSYNGENAKLLRQPALVTYLRSKLDQISPKLRQDKLVGKVSGELQGISAMVSFAPDHTPSADEVKNLNSAAGKLTKEISNGE